MITHEIIQQMERELKSNLEQLMLAKHETRNERIVALFHSYTRKLIESVAEEIVGEKVQGAKGDAKRFNYDPEWYEGYNACIAEQRLKVKETLSNLK